MSETEQLQCATKRIAELEAEIKRQEEFIKQQSLFIKRFQETLQRLKEKFIKPVRPKCT